MNKNTANALFMGYAYKGIHFKSVKLIKICFISSHHFSSYQTKILPFSTYTFSTKYAKIFPWYYHNGRRFPSILLEGY
ncbi:MAG: hypothetical protein R3Y24_16050, partial [Eubacteriales bacterium]